MTDQLQAKAEMYESKAVQYKERAQAAEGPRRAFYEGLADYCTRLATDFRQVLAKRAAA